MPVKTAAPLERRIVAQVESIHLHRPFWRVILRDNFNRTLSLGYGIIKHWREVHGDWFVQIGDSVECYAKQAPIGYDVTNIISVRMRPKIPA